MTKSLQLRTKDHGLRTTDHGLRTILVRAPNWVGDAVMALPALRELRRIFAGSRITLAARPWVLGLFDGEQLADNLISLTDAGGVFGRVVHFVSAAGRFRR